MSNGTGTATKGAAAQQAGNPDNYIEVDNLVKKYGKVTAVDGISLKIRRGEIFAFLGPNGAGKTTTVEIIETIRTPTSGSIRLKGLDVGKRINDVKRIIGVLPQEFSSFDRLTVKETIDYYAALYDRRLETAYLLRLINLEEHAGKQYKHLSGGLKQRVGIAVALVNDPEVVFLDEPTTGLDPAARREVWKVIADLKKNGKTVFLTTHYMEEAEELADHVAIIHRGKIISEGTVDELIEKHGFGLSVLFKGTDSAFGEVLKGLGYRPEPDHDMVRARVKDKNALLDLLASLKGNGVDFSEIIVRKSNLEEIFLKLTGEQLKDGDAR